MGFELFILYHKAIRSVYTDIVRTNLVARFHNQYLVDVIKLDLYFPKIKKLKKSLYRCLNLPKKCNNATKQTYTPKLFIAFEMTYY